MHMNPVFDKLPIRLSSNFNVERGQFLGYIDKPQEDNPPIGVDAI
jgi:hypothetical protein